MYNRITIASLKVAGNLAVASVIVRHLFRLVWIIIARAHKIPLTRQLASRDSVYHIFFVTIYEIVIKPRELVARRGFRDSTMTVP